VPARQTKRETTRAPLLDFK